MIVPPVAENSNIGNAFLIGFIICCLSFGAAVLLVLIDKYAEKKDGDEQMKVSDEDKFKISDLKTFNLSFWLISISCTIVYMAILPVL